MRKTKIICTIGPACSSKEVLTEMCKCGMNVARLNFSHGTHEEHQAKIDLIKSIREELNLPIAIMLDTKGPEYRIGCFKDGQAEIVDGQDFILTVDDVEGDNTKVSVSYKNLMNEINPGDTILVCDGLIQLSVSEVKEREALCKVVVGGKLSNKKSMSFPNHVLKGDYLSEQDKQDLLFGIQNDVDFVAASFVSSKDDVLALRHFLDDNGGRDIAIIAKIENRSGVDNADAICDISDGLMVARGDLGVELPITEIPAVQKYLINKCRLSGKIVITATEMLESMTYNPRPTRAEVSDVANAVYDGSSAVMLSGETASGKYPVQALKTMAETAEFTEQNIRYGKRLRATNFLIKNNVDAVSKSTCEMAIDTNSRGIVISSLSGRTVRMVSRFRGPVDIIGMTTNEKVYRQLNLSWGVTPVLSEEFNSVDVMFYHALRFAKEIFGLEKGDNVVLTGGSTSGKINNTNTIRIETI